MLKIYLASSWRNTSQQTAVAILREAGHDVYDFKNPLPDNQGFHWKEIDAGWQAWTSEEFRQALFHPIAEKGFNLDFSAMKEADIGVMLLPCGRSAHLEAGYFVGANKPLYIIGDIQEPELMYRMAARYCISITELLTELDNYLKLKRNNGACLHGCRYADEAWKGLELKNNWLKFCPHGFKYNPHLRKLPI